LNRASVWWALWLLPAVACRSPEARIPSTDGPLALEPEWQDALPAAPKLLVSLRPKELRADRIYGPMLQRALELAHERHVTSGALVLDAIEDAEEVVAELDDGSSSNESGESAPQELLLVLRGTRSDIDPAKLVGADGELLWSAGPNGAVPELVHERDHDGTPNPTSLFELPDRTWVVASGPARDRARDAFARPSHRSAPHFASDSLATVRISGPSLMARVPLLRSAGPLAVVGRDLRSVSLELPAPAAPTSAPSVSSNSGSPRQVRALGLYSDAQAAAEGADALREILGVVARLKPTELSWITTSQVDVSGAEVIVAEPVPIDLLRSVLYAGRPNPGP
jgi:hypothetical protein